LELKDTVEKRIVKCGVRNVKAIREFNIKEDIKAKNHIFQAPTPIYAKSARPADLNEFENNEKMDAIESPTTYKLFRISVL
jgi:hypothetical protein